MQTVARYCVIEASTAFISTQQTTEYRRCHGTAKSTVFWLGKSVVTLEFKSRKKGNPQPAVPLL
jgi:hypothetical protein